MYLQRSEFHFAPLILECVTVKLYELEISMRWYLMMAKPKSIYQIIYSLLKTFNNSCTKQLKQQYMQRLKKIFKVC